MMPADPNRQEEQPSQEPVAPQRRRWSDAHDLLTDAILTTTERGVLFSDRFDGAHYAVYALLGRLEGKADQKWLAAVEKRADEILPEPTTISPEGQSGVVQVQIGRDSNQLQRFPESLAVVLIQREDERIYRDALQRIRPILRELIEAAIACGVLEWKRSMPALHDPELEDDGEPETEA